MSDETKQNTEEEIDPIYLMEEIIDKLKILDYETSFLKQK